MAAATSSDLVAQLRQYRLLEAPYLEEIERKLVPQLPEPKALAKELLKRRWLSPFQVNQLFLGRGKALLLGSYILLDRLGGGGMGDVFKARNWKIGTLFAIKVIRKDRITDKATLDRFRREIRAAAKLNHPNIVKAHDADEVGGTLLLVMEYVEGTDLAKLVKVNGALPIDQACDFIRQAAQGLQHAYEQGMVHRDIKPHNLLVTTVKRQESGARRQESGVRGQKSEVRGQKSDSDGEEAVVKILDMGLARLAQVSEESGSTSSMTQEGAILGTPDYIAPEQARESHTVDIRADLYSLGCTFYFLLAGAVPFPKGSLVQKLYKHQFEEPAQIETQRAELPVHVAAIVRKLMAKQPEHRFQTPAELIEALRTGEVGEISEGSSQAMTVAMAKASATTDKEIGEEETADIWSAIGATPETIVPKKAVSASSIHFKPNKTMLYIGGGVLGLGLAIVVFWLLFGRGPAQVAETNDAGKGGATIPTVPTTKSEEPTKHAPSAAALEQVKQVVESLRKLNPGFDGTHKPAFDNDAVVGLEFSSEKVADLSPLKALTSLKHLSCKGKPATVSLLTNLAALKGLSLESLDIRNTQVLDLTPVRDAPLHQLSLDYKPWRDQPILQGMKTLQTINDMSVEAFWKQASAAQAKFEQWAAGVAAHPWQKQVQEVSEELRRRNPGFDGKVDPLISKDAVTGLTFPSDEVTDISPVRALPALVKLNCQGSAPGKGKLTDLAPLTGLPLVDLFVSYTNVADLGPVRGMPLVQFQANATSIADLTPLQGLPLTLLNLQSTRIKDLTPLTGMPLKILRVGPSQVSDLSPLKGMRLDTLGCPNTQVMDLTPLQDMPLKYLNISNTKVGDLTPLKGLPLADLVMNNSRVTDFTPLKDVLVLHIQLGFNPWRDADALRAVKTLQTINKQPTAVVWKNRDAFDAWCKEVAAMKPDEQEKAVVQELKKRNPTFDSPVTREDFKGAITLFEFQSDKVVDISPVRALPNLKRLSVAGSGPGKGVLADLWPLSGVPIVYLNAENTKVIDLTPLRDSKVEYLYLAGTPALNLTPLRGLSLKEIRWPQFLPQRDLPHLRSITTLQKINDEPAAEFLKKAAAKK